MAPMNSRAACVLLSCASGGFEHCDLPSVVEVVLRDAVEQKVERVVSAGDRVTEPLVRKTCEGGYQFVIDALEPFDRVAPVLLGVPGDRPVLLSIQLRHR